MLLDTVVSQAMLVKDLRAAIDTQLFRDLLGPAPQGAKWDLGVPFSCKIVNGKYVTRGVSTCGLVAAGILRNAGVALPWNGYSYWASPRPYRGLDIVSELTLLGQLSFARVGKPLPGCVACIGSGLGTHVLTIVDVQGDTVTSVDGGQIDDYAHGYLQRVKLCTRQWSAKRVAWIIDPSRIGTTWTVADTQAKLMVLNYKPGPIDGIAGPLTRAAIIAFQRDHWLQATGVVDQDTLPVLRAA